MIFKCAKIRSQMLKHPTLTANETNEILAHISECASCSIEYSKTKMMNELTTNAPRYCAPGDFTSKVMARIDRAEEAVRDEKNTRPWFVRRAVAAILIAAIGLGFATGGYLAFRPDPLDTAIISALRSNPMDIFDI